MLFMNSGEWEGTPLLPASWVKESWKSHVQVDRNYSLGYLWWILPLDGHRTYKMWGYGGQYVYLVPSLELLVVLTADTKKEWPEMDGDTFMTRYVLPAVETKPIPGLLSRWLR